VSTEGKMLRIARVCGNNDEGLPVRSGGEARNMNAAICESKAMDRGNGSRTGTRRGDCLAEEKKDR